jgi:hypothetical protein
MSYRELDETTWLDWGLMGSIAIVMTVALCVAWVFRLPGKIWRKMK